MKKILVLTGIFLFGCAGLSAQSTMELVNHPLKMNNAVISSELKSKEMQEAVGSPYYNDAFMPSYIQNYEGRLALRFNAYTGDMEFEHEGELYALTKEEYSEVIMGPMKKHYIYTPYEQNGKAEYGFLVKLNESETHPAYKREIISYTEPHKATSHYDSDKPGIFKEEKPEYYIFWDGRIRDVHSNKKRFAKMFGSKDKAVLDFINKSKINQNTDEGIIQISTFLDSLD